MNSQSWRGLGGERAKRYKNVMWNYVNIMSKKIETVTIAVGDITSH